MPPILPLHHHHHHHQQQQQQQHPSPSHGEHHPHRAFAPSPARLRAVSQWPTDTALLAVSAGQCLAVLLAAALPPASPPSLLPPAFVDAARGPALLAAALDPFGFLRAGACCYGVLPVAVPSAFAFIPFAAAVAAVALVAAALAAAPATRRWIAASAASVSLRHNAGTGAGSTTTGDHVNMNEHPDENDNDDGNDDEDGDGDDEDYVGRNRRCSHVDSVLQPHRRAGDGIPLMPVRRREHARARTRRAPIDPVLIEYRWRRAGWIAAQVAAVPIGLVWARLCVCRDGALDVDPSVPCWGGTHLAVFVPAVAAALVYLFVLPLLAARRISEQVLFRSASAHERYLQLKEAAFTCQLDSTWALLDLHRMSSFRSPCSITTPVTTMMHGLLILWLGVLSSFPTTQALLMLLTVFAYTLGITFLRPFRVNSLNWLATLLAWCTSANYLILYMLVLGVLSPLLIPSAVLVELSIINCAAAVAIALFIAYLVCRDASTLSASAYVNAPQAFSPLPRLLHSCIAGRNCCGGRVWPTRPPRDWSLLNSTERDEVLLLTEAIELEKRAERSGRLLIPTYELHDMVLRLHDALHRAKARGDEFAQLLEDVRDELISIHNNTAPLSIFGGLQGSGGAQVAWQLKQLLPGFCARLQRRQQELILVSPRLRRILLKMTAVAAFIGSRPINRARYVSLCVWLWFEFASVRAWVCVFVSGSICV
jgi:hypothetical protein